MKEDEKTIHQKLIGFYNELERKICAYFNPKDEDPDLFLVRLLFAVTSWDEKLAVKILKAKRNYSKTWLILEIRESVHIDCIKELLGYCSLLWILPPEMPEDVAQISDLGEYYESIVNSERARLINKLIEQKYAAVLSGPEKERESISKFKEDMAKSAGWAYMTESRLRREVKMRCKEE